MPAYLGVPGDDLESLLDLVSCCAATDVQEVGRRASVQLEGRGWEEGGRRQEVEGRRQEVEGGRQKAVVRRKEVECRR